MFNNREGIHLNPQDLHFSVLSSEDTKRLSVVKIVTGLSFDVLGNALPGGLYDVKMGPYSLRNIDPCSTCLQTAAGCPGHFGHIELNALVFNPFFTKAVYDILRLACLDCFRLQYSDHLEKIVELQLNLVDAGWIIEAQDLDIYKSEYVAMSGRSIETENGVLMHPKIAEMYELLHNGVKNFTSVTKTTTAIRYSIVKSSIANNSSKKCIHCNKMLKKVKSAYGKLVIGVSKAEMAEFYDARAHGNETEARADNKAILADECRRYLRNIYEKSPALLKNLYPILKNSSKNVESPVDIFFMNIVQVIPPATRPANVLMNQIADHPRTVVYRNIIEANAVFRSIFSHLKKPADEISAEMQNVFTAAKGNTPYEKLYIAWTDLQSSVDQILDVSLSSEKNTQGLKQLLEKKEGLIRKHMMGKRVNFAARTVITPDPNINVDELGIPEIFAKKLSYPVPVTPWNVSELRKMVMNGPDVHPGANYVEDEKGHKILIPPDNTVTRESLAKLLLNNPADGIKIVHRHLRNGDMLLLNRQPTLHKPSIMAHKARVLKGEKTFRLHYSNCKAYNADFDGDEMNAHFPQNEVGRSEAYNLVNVSNQYLVPKDGTPLGGLIQDHVISGVKLSMRGRFFNKEDYHQLVFQGLSHLRRNIKLLPPAIVKPFRLWSGKQILSTVIINLIPEGYPGINLTSTAKINVKAWDTHYRHDWTCGGTPTSGLEMTESEVIIRDGELMVGVLDKTHYGATPYGLVHCMYELYGGDCSTQMLSSLAKLFATFLQREGFTLGVHDILVNSEADKKRHSIIEDCKTIGPEVAAAALDIPNDTPFEELSNKMAEAYTKDRKFRTILDRKYKSVLDGYTNEINKTCLPAGLISKFPHNNLQLMVLSGAKGSTVNTMQISSLLGQIELEGKRPPLMISGKSLPSFPTFETSPKSGGFIHGRFMTGIQPQDFFFHCMAGREGLIDTAVKTSRSGYLQRCLVKHLEGLNVQYDGTVRDSDNSVVQFMYGEDGMDIAKSRFFNKKSLKFLDENAKAILVPTKQLEQKGIQNEISDEISRSLKKLKKWRKKNGDPILQRRISSFQKFSEEIRSEIEVSKPNKLNKRTGRRRMDEEIINLWSNASLLKKETYSKKHEKCPDPIVATYPPDNFYGSVTEYLDNLMRSYFKERPERKEIFTEVMYVKSMKSLAEPGEAVGLLAAQSIGEPSTQMTLNTFHFAGRGEMNVTLGIPRLREILMLASANIKTPSMDIPFHPNKEERAEKLRIKLNRVTVADVLEYVNVQIRLVLLPERSYQYTTYFKFLPRDAYCEDFCLKPKNILKYMNEKFFKFLFRAIVKSAQSKSIVVDIESSSDKRGKQAASDDNDIDAEVENFDKTTAGDRVDVDSSDDEGNLNDDDDATAVKLKNKRQDENDYEDPEDAEEIKDANDDVEDDPEILDELDASKVSNEDDKELTSITGNALVNDYVYDKKKHLWCKLTFNLTRQYKNIDVSNIIKEIARKSVIHEAPQIKRAITYMQNDDLTLKTDGINIAEMFKYHSLLNLNRLYSNDIHGMARTYGIEAASRVIVKEVQNVFKVYGIVVDPRHLLLIADYMTFDGTFKPLSRKGMEFSSSPLQQMSFESSLQFLKSATVNGRTDDLSSPSSRLMVGLPVKSGTGSFDLFLRYAQ